MAAFINVRIVAPVIAGIGLAATFGAGVTAQLGSMRIAEEIDALESMAIRPVSYLVSTRIVAGMIAVTPLYSIAVILSFFASRFVTVVLLGQSGGLYDHYFTTFLNPIDLLWSFLQAISMALAILLMHTYFGYFATGGPAGVGVAVGNAVRDLAGRRGIGDVACFTGRLRLQRQLQPVGLGRRADETGYGAPAGGSGDDYCDSGNSRPCRGFVPRQFHPDRAGYRVIAARRPGDESGRQGEDARCTGRAGSPPSRRCRTGKPPSTWRWIPSQLHLIPANVLVDIASTTVFGAKYVQLMPPADPSPQPMHAGQVLDAQTRHGRNQHGLRATHVGAVEDRAREAQRDTRCDRQGAERPRPTSSARRSVDLRRVSRHGGTESVRRCDHDLAVAPDVFNAYADAAPDLVRTVDNATRISQTIVDEQQNLDALLVSAIGLADIGNDVVANQQAAADRCPALLVPTTDLTNQYNPALTCGLARHCAAAGGPPVAGAGAAQLRSRSCWASNGTGTRADLPKVAATGGPQCTDLPNVPFGKRPPFVVTDIGANPWQYGNQGISAEFRRPQAVVVRADRRAAAQHRTDRATGMTGSRYATAIKFACVRGRDGGADRLSLPRLRPVPNRRDQRLFGGVLRRRRA